MRSRSSRVRRTRARSRSATAQDRAVRPGLRITSLDIYEDAGDRRRGRRPVSGERSALVPVGWVGPPGRPGRRADAGSRGRARGAIEFEPELAAALDGIQWATTADLTWLHLADRSVLRVHPRDDPSVPERGVFATRSPDRPNPIGLHPVEVLAVDGLTLRVSGIEAIDGRRWWM